ncbi:hypothetical protein [Roseofilum casamattae]|uniref:Uncharacterized protein n=1 Tax=Roseofilum casamattae BLCC-M143 TaxID=3022442 RepID=A0ABT7C4H9_9CYAN|nr:hypothetical protein [Roseofilum casamattae]MDJ1185839.1 hypothetical protein [Roseofilum casamattae BLCC-M143]
MSKPKSSEPSSPKSAPEETLAAKPEVKPDATTEAKPEKPLTPPRVQRPKAAAAPSKPQPTAAATPVSKPEKSSRAVPKPRKAAEGSRDRLKPEKPEPVPEHGDRKAGDEIVLPYSGKTVQIGHFYQSAGYWYAAFEVGCVRIDALDKMSENLTKS